ncbi:hypothetical protein [Streptomyces sp. NPDC048192]|jgi:hypothetical protein|uniref:hypothetical protein n=1 Tax=Streptomyces sp. NPDC048192 TaxID=3365510 RepID=UPI003722D493
MPGLPARRLASSALCAALLAGITGPAALAADSAGEPDRAASRSPVPGADKLLAQVRALDNTGSVLQPVVDLLKESLTKGRLPADQARALADAAHAAVARAAAQAQPAGPATPTAPAAPTPAATPSAPAAPTAAEPAAATPTAPALPAKPSTPAAPSVPTAPATPAKPSAPVTAPAAAKPAAAAAPAALTKHLPVHASPSARDATDDLLAALDAAVDKLVKAVTSELDQLLSSAGGVVDDLLGLLTSGLLGGALPAPSLTALPSLPSLPTTG